MGVPDGPLRAACSTALPRGIRTAWKRAAPDGTIGRIPVLLRGEVYFFSFLDRGRQGGPVGRSDRRTAGRGGATLSREEFEAIGRKAAGATISFQNYTTSRSRTGFWMRWNEAWYGGPSLILRPLRLHCGTLAIPKTPYSRSIRRRKIPESCAEAIRQHGRSQRFGHNLPAVFENSKI